jgi:DNA (cytosine-5)-methyltransferase 1
MIRAGFRVLAAVDFNKEAVATARENLGVPEIGGQPRHVDSPIPHVLAQDLTTLGPKDLAKLIGCDQVDVIVGGPPCQGFSSARQRDGANHGEKRFVEDARRHLYKEFLKYVAHFRPRVFVMENVLGIRSAAGGEYYTRVLHEARRLGYRVQSQIEDAYRLGVPQKRRRQLFIGVRADIAEFFPSEVAPAPRAMAGTNFGAALADLPPLRAGTGEYSRRYDSQLREAALAMDDQTRNYLIKVLEVDKAQNLTGHVARPHNDLDLKCFRSLREGENSAKACRRDPMLYFPYDRETFKDRYTRQSRSAACSTIVAHLSKDGLMFIHPVQNRSITPREAARAQSFPDWFTFPEARTHAFRLIGNAVPPLVAEAVGLAVKSFLESCTSLDTEAISRSDEVQALEAWFEHPGAPAHLNDEALLRLWRGLLLSHPELHPINALDHGPLNEVTRYASTVPGLNVSHRIVERYKRSGWPVKLAPLATEVWARYNRGQLNDQQLFCGRRVIH